MPPFQRTRTGCFTCREDGYKCDEKKPICGRCTRLRKTCKGYGVRLKWQAPEQPEIRAPRTKRQKSSPRTGYSPPTSSSSIASQSPSSMVLSPAAVTSEHGTSMELYLLHHWSTTLVTVVSMAAASHNPFLLHLSPMMAYSTALRAAICSMAASHLAALKDEASLRTLAARYQLQAVSALRHTIQTEDAQLSLATILMLQVSDRMFTTDSRVDHLAGASAVIKRGGLDARTSSSASFLLSLCKYYDILASVTRGASPVLDLDDQFLPVEGTVSMQGLSAVMGIVSQISRMHGQRSQSYDVKGRAIQQALELLDSTNYERDVGNTIEACKHAAYIYLYRVWQHPGASLASPTQHAKDCLAHLRLVPVCSPLASAHVWPLWTAGCESINQDERDFVLSRIASMYDARHLPSLRRMKQDVEHVWSAKDERRIEIGVDNVDCMRHIRENKHREVDLV
ncbi:fungal-specific transcription factor domain-containing protein [Xylariaceae sp. FL0016]|nr:fungal-specific transcription factor domain-containing protein [Xylariaceae sp. FL0016]